MAENTIIHEINLAGYKATSAGGMLDLGTWGSYGIEKLHLTLDAAWQNLTITAFFNVKGKVVAKKVVGKDGYADVPWEATKESTFAGRIVFEGSMNGQRRITTDLNYKVSNHSEITDIDPVPTDDRWNQFVTENKEYRDGAFEAAERANARAEDAEAASDDAQAAARAAKASEAAAKASENAAVASENNASISAGAAAVSEGNAAASADKAKASETAAAESASKAAASEKAAAVSAVAAAGSAAQAEAQKTAAAKSASDAQDYMQTASGAATAANTSAENAAGSKSAAASSATAAAVSATAAAGDAKTANDAATVATDAKAAAVAAQKDAAASKAAAANSEIAAKTSEDAAAKSAADAGRTASSINDSMTQIAANKEAVSRLKEDTAALQKRQNVLVGRETGNPIAVDDAFAALLCGLNVYGKSTQDGTPTPDSPVPIVSAGDSGSVVVKVTGANILYLPYIEESTVGGITYSVKNGVIKIKGTSTGKSIWLLRNIKLFVGTWVFNPNPVKGTESSNCYLDLTNTISLGFSIRSNNINKPVKITELNVKHPFYLGITSTAGSVIDMEWKPQMLLSDKLLPYSPYREQLLTLPTPNGLPGIPVTSGGNYTDPQGQQWVCDEVDLERGVKVQRVGKAEIEKCIVSRDPNWYDASKSYSYQILTWKGSFNTTIDSGGPCNRFIAYTFINFYNKGIEAGFLISAVETVFNISKSLGICTTAEEFKTWFNENVVLYKILATPIETPLTPAEIAAYKALITYAPNTVVQASDDAGIKLCYQRDVNIVVKNLEDAIASMTTT